jgi:hypothetical protein
MPSYSRKTSNYSDMMELVLQFAQWKPTRQNRQEFKE